VTAEVIELDVVTSLDLPPERILRKAQEAGLTEVVVIGLTDDGREYFCSSVADGGNVLWHLERARHRLMRQVDDMMDDE